MADHKITVHTEDGIWLLGAVDDYPFEAKVCDENSGFGIDCGRVIKLHIRGKQASGEIAAYERGWDRFPKGAHKGPMSAAGTGSRRARTKGWLGRSFTSANPCRSRRSGEARF